MAKFDSLICVDYSAASAPTLGADSLWVGGMIAGQPVLTNFATRRELHSWLNDQMDKHLARGQRMLAGFDFAFAYPRGFAGALGLAGAPWSATWALIENGIVEGAKNKNNRFQFANDLNQRLGQAAPFWGCPANLELPYLHAKKTVSYTNGFLEWRAFETQVRTMQSGWKLAYAGSVGGQSLCGIAQLERHRQKFGSDLSIWPFEDAVAPLVFAEIYPSLFPNEHIDHEIKDARQVLATAQAMADADLQAWLDVAQFDDDPAIRREEGWLLSWPRAV